MENLYVYVQFLTIRDMQNNVILIAIGCIYMASDERIRPHE